MKIDEIKEGLRDKSVPFGVDLLLPQVGGNARKTNYDYTHGDLPELIDITIESGAKLFVSAVGVPPKWAVDKLHAAGIPIMNMIGSPVHVQKALDAGVDIICAQGGEGGGHTGEVATSILIPMVVDLVKGKKSPLTGKQVPVVAAGGIYDARGLAMALALGADGVWVGTRFVASAEGGASKNHKAAVVNASVHDTHRCEAFTGRPLRIVKTPYSRSWLGPRIQEMYQLLQDGKLPAEKDMEEFMKLETDEARAAFLKNVGGEMPSASNIHLSGQVAGAIQDIQPAQKIIDDMVSGAAEILRQNAARVSVASSKL
eukprot:TRINITY_DN34138_c0_g1_i1.p1 TRINITY_DN34138_c0_g1~~TRINITY_DN34138_c0_g1_i1.p1  ORF type:complete len:314 (+),score=84.02 TRINITY_DN34138_c0_g1_i1:461-1402(+)